MTDRRVLLWRQLREPALNRLRVTRA